MEQSVRVPEEHGSGGRDPDRDLLEIKFLNYDPIRDMVFLFPCFWKFQYFVNQDDYSGVETIEGIPFTKLELYLSQLKSEGCQFQLAMNADGTVCLGFLMYHLIAGCILFIRGMYVEPGLEAQGIAYRLVQSLGKPIQKVIFQTQVGTPPVRLLGVTAKHRKKIYDGEKLTTWEMDWREKP